MWSLPCRPQKNVVIVPTTTNGCPPCRVRGPAGRSHGQPGGRQPWGGRARRGRPAGGPAQPWGGRARRGRQPGRLSRGEAAPAGQRPGQAHADRLGQPAEPAQPSGVHQFGVLRCPGQRPGITVRVTGRQRQRRAPPVQAQFPQRRPLGGEHGLARSRGSPGRRAGIQRHVRGDVHGPVGDSGHRPPRQVAGQRPAAGPGRLDVPVVGGDRDAAADPADHPGPRGAPGAADLGALPAGAQRPPVADPGQVRRTGHGPRPLGAGGRIHLDHGRPGGGQFHHVQRDVVQPFAGDHEPGDRGRRLRAASGYGDRARRAAVPPPPRRRRSARPAPARPAPARPPRPASPRPAAFRPAAPARPPLPGRPPPAAPARPARLRRRGEHLLQQFGPAGADVHQVDPLRPAEPGVHLPQQFQHRGGVAGETWTEVRK